MQYRSSIHWLNKNEIIKVPLEKLPIKLPENINLNTKGNPLDHQKEAALYLIQF